MFFKRVILLVVGLGSGALHFLLGVGECCRYSPTCSRYAQEALHHHSPLKALGLIVRRLLRCHPWGSFGEDPVPLSMRK